MAEADCTSGAILGFSILLKAFGVQYLAQGFDMQLSSAPGSQDTNQ